MIHLPKPLGILAPYRLVGQKSRRGNDGLYGRCQCRPVGGCMFRKSLLRVSAATSGIEASLRIRQRIGFGGSSRNHCTWPIAPKASFWSPGHYDATTLTQPASNEKLDAYIYWNTFVLSLEHIEVRIIVFVRPRSGRVPASTGWRGAGGQDTQRRVCTIRTDLDCGRHITLGGLAA